MGTLDAAIEVDRGDQRLDGVREDVLLHALPGRVGAATEPQRRAELDGPRPRRERVGVHERRAHERQLALVGRRKAIDEQPAHAEAEHCVAEELEALIVGRTCATLLVREARMRERLLETSGRAKANGFGCWWITAMKTNASSSAGWTTSPS